VTIERRPGGHGSASKARPTLPRTRTLQAVDTVAKPAVARGPDGRFGAGNRAAHGARFTHAVRKSLGSKASEGEALVVARDARRVFGHVLHSLPSDAPPVRALLAVYSRHQALHAFFTCKAEVVGLDTKDGLALLQEANRQSQRAERTLVTCFDIARVCAQQAARQTSPIAGLFAAPEEHEVAPSPSAAAPGDAGDDGDDRGSDEA
jgi:hypothetical protein